MVPLTTEDKQALTRAVEAVELGSSAEVVVAVVPASTSPLVPALLAATMGAAFGLAFLLFSPWPFSHAAILIDSMLCGAVAYAVCHRSTWLQRVLTPVSVVKRCVQHAAKAEFVDRGVVETRGRTGLLVFVSQLECVARVVADRGVLASVDAERFQRGVARIEQLVSARRGWNELAGAVADLGPILADAFPRGDDDINELGDGL